MLSKKGDVQNSIISEPRLEFPGTLKNEINFDQYDFDDSRQKSLRNIGNQIFCFKIQRKWSI